MRSQTSKPLPRKGALNKTSFKSNSPSKQDKRKTTHKKVQNLIKKSLVKPTKKTKTREDVVADVVTPEVKNEPANIKSGSAKPSQSRGSSPTKKNKGVHKEKKETPKLSSETPTKKPVAKKATSQPPRVVKKVKPSAKKKATDVEDIKYKLNSDLMKTNSKFSKAKTIVKKRPILAQKKKSNKDIKKKDLIEKVVPLSAIKCLNPNAGSVEAAPKVLNASPHNEKNGGDENDKTEKSEIHENKTNTTNNSSTNPLVVLSTEATKPETERPPKFFTSSRSPRTVDIDIKCCKTAKGNLNVSERFLSLKCGESKNEDNCKDKNNDNNLISQGSEIDVYTFTEKVDSPKSILSSFRSPMNKNVGRVRPIARVKGTIIDKNKVDTEKKKYPPHRPIEEVVKQLKANKKSEDLKTNQLVFSDSTSSAGTDSSTIKSDDEEKPKPIVSKSYKMVARKTSIPGKPFSPIKFLEQEPSPNTKFNKGNIKNSSPMRKSYIKTKNKTQKVQISDEEIETSKFSLNTNSKVLHYSSSDESVSESNDDNDTKESSESDTPKNKVKNKKYKRITDSARKKPSKELLELSKDSLVDLKDESALSGKDKPSKRRLKLLSMWTGPKKHRMASLNAIAKVHCLYENESRTHMELGLMKTVDRQVIPGSIKGIPPKKKELKTKDNDKRESTSESEYERRDKSNFESSEEDQPSTRTLRGVPGIRSAGKYWDPKSSTSSSDDSELDSKKKVKVSEKKKTPVKASSSKSDSDKPPAKIKKTSGVPVKKKRNRNEVVMDLKDMVVQKRMASLNATAILAASYEKRSPKSSKDDTTSDSCSDESFSQKPKNGVSSGVKSESKNDAPKKEAEETTSDDRKQKVEVIVNQDTDVTITGVYATHHHEGFCVSGMQYRISSTSHTQTTATANCEKEGCTREDGARYTPLSALSSMQPPAEHLHGHPHPVTELGGLTRRAAGCSSAFSAPPPASHHEPGKMSSPGFRVYEPTMPPISPIGYYQPAGPLIKESGADPDRALARYHPPPHYHPPHAPVLQQYGQQYYPADLCYGRYYRQAGPYHMPPPPQPDAQMVGVPGEPYPPPQYYGGPPCYQHAPQRLPYIEYRCPCPMNACPKNVLIGPATGKPPTGGGPADVTSAHAPPGGPFRMKVRAARALDSGSGGKDPPLEPEPVAVGRAPHPCPSPAVGGASPKREQLYDVRDNLRLAGDTPGPAEAVGPPSPARGYAGACAPQPPTAAPRRARLGKAMARRSLAGDDTGSLLGAPRPPPAHHSDADDDVLAVSPPICAPIDLSSSDETERRSTPLLDVKKENEGPTYTSPRKPDAQALREHNSSAALPEPAGPAEAAKPVKRRYSKPKLEIELRDVQLEDGCKTNGIGEHVKLQKRRKIVPELNDLSRGDTISVDKEAKKKSSPKAKKTPTPQTTEKKILKRKVDGLDVPRVKKLHIDTSSCQEISRVKCIGPLALDKDPIATKPKTKSALVLDNLIRKNSVDRPDTNNIHFEENINPAELFLSPNEHITQNGMKKTLNINNNIVDDNIAVNGVRSKTIAAVTQLITKKLPPPKITCKTEKGEMIESKITTHILKPIKSVLKQPTEKTCLKEDHKKLKKLEMQQDNITIGEKSFKSEKTKLKQFVTANNNNIQKSKINAITDKLMSEALSEKSMMSNRITSVPSDITKSPKAKLYIPNSKLSDNSSKPIDRAIDKANDTSSRSECEKTLKRDLTQIADQIASGMKALNRSDKPKPEKITKNRSKLSIDKGGEGKEKGSNEKVVKLLVSKKSVIKADEPALLVEEACGSPMTIPVALGRRARRRRSGARRPRRAPALLAPPASDASRAPPRWSNGWDWDGEHFLSKVYVNNDTRLDRMARCWSRMSHTSGDRVSRGDCVLLRASSARAQPFVARVAHLWENPDDGEMMVSLVWYYRPEHTERGRQPEDAPDEVFASRHRDANSVACIEDKCYVLTYNEYCRYRKRLKASEEGIPVPPCIVPPMPHTEVTPPVTPNDTKLPPAVSAELVLFCRKIYDFRSKKLQVPNK